jgi:hypothetical protein
MPALHVSQATYYLKCALSLIAISILGANCRAIGGLSCGELQGDADSVGQDR